MAQLIVRNLEDSLVTVLKRRAALLGHSAEEEHRRILRDALSRETPTLDLKDYLLLDSESLPDLDLPERQHSAERESSLL